MFVAHGHHKTIPEAACRRQSLCRSYGASEDFLLHSTYKPSAPTELNPKSRIQNPPPRPVVFPPIGSTVSEKAEITLECRNFQRRTTNNQQPTNSSISNELSHLKDKFHRMYQNAQNARFDTKCTQPAPLLTKEGWQPLRLTGWFSCESQN